MGPAYGTLTRQIQKMDSGTESALPDSCYRTINVAPLKSRQQFHPNHQFPPYSDYVRR